VYLGTLILPILALAAAAPPPKPTPAHHSHKRRESAADPEKEALRKKVADTQKAMETLDSRILELMGKTAILRQQLESEAVGKAEAQSKLEAANATVASLQNRLSDIEARAERLAAEKATAQKAAPAQQAPHAPRSEETKLQAQLADITRRRDNYISSILQRYRELANEYRSFGASFASQSDRDGAPKTGPDLTRIQNTIALVEEDLRQLNGLESQALLVRKAQAKPKAP
jgi:chromosome segregation ATPase